MKVYIVTDGTYSDYGIEAVFTDQRQADLYAATHHCRAVEEWDADTVRIESNEKTFVCYRFVVSNGYLHLQGRNYSTHKINRVDEAEIIVSIEKKDDQKAEKIARDMYAEYMAKNECL